MLRPRVRLVDSEAPSPQPCPLLRLGRLWQQGPNVLVGRLVCGQVVELVLGKIANGDLVGGVAPPRQRRQSAREQLGERAFAVAIGAQQSNPIVGVKAEV